MINRDPKFPTFLLDHHGNKWAIFQSEDSAYTLWKLFIVQDSPSLSVCYESAGVKFNPTVSLSVYSRKSIGFCVNADDSI